MGDVWEVSEAGLTAVHRSENGTSWQPYTMLKTAGDRVIVGEYPAGGIFEYNAANRSLDYMEPNVGVEPGALQHVREAQTLMIYGDELFVGVWPWGALWGASAREHNAPWTLRRRLFHTPAVDHGDAAWVTHIVDTTGKKSQNDGWGQVRRSTYLALQVHSSDTAPLHSGSRARAFMKDPFTSSRAPRTTKTLGTGTSKI